MDANNTRFHLIASAEDWASTKDSSPAGGESYYDAERGWLGLQPQLKLFPGGRRALPLDPADRRGAASDRFGSWYWIGHDRRTIFRAPAGTKRAVIYWQQRTPPPSPRAGDFVSQTPPPVPVELAGLTVTTHHYLVVGTLDPAGLLIFDLHDGGDPVAIHFPADMPFVPFDMAAGPDALTWVLDRENRRLWGLDRYFRLLPLGDLTPGQPDAGGFVPADGDQLPLTPPTATLSGGIALPAQDPIAVEALPDGSVLILDSMGIGVGSHLYHYPPGFTPGSLLNSPAHLPLPGLAEVTAGGVDHPMAAYDMALDPDPTLLHLVEEDGNQAIAYRLNFDEATALLISAEPQAIFLPMHYFGGRSLARGRRPHGNEAIFYDVTPSPTQDEAVRWIRLHEIDQPLFARFAWVETEPFDSRQRGAVWHRLFVDGCIPPETAVEVWTRAGNDPDLLQSQPFVREPDLYLRGRGAEIPYWDGWQRSEQTPSQAAHTGVWELLFQAARGQYLQIRLILSGNGRASPQIARLRVYSPRFSYVKNYLPAAYQEDPGSADFLERFLANIEGFITDLEGKIANSSLLFDPSSAPAEALDWLATWLGLVLDPLWSKLWDEDRRRLLIRFAPRLYAQRGTPEGVRFALLLLLDPCLERTLKALEQAASIPNPALRQELESLGLAYPTLASGEAVIEDLLWNYVLAAPGRTSVRIVEAWQARQGMALQAGDPTEEADGDPGLSLKEALDEAKHRFSVLVPEDLSDEHRAMVEKIIRLEKPAHTRYDVRRFWDLFLVGQVRLGIDTILGEEGRFLPIILGRDYLAEGYLESVG
ncbi:MAG: hypothetical protein KF893_09165 [Caldilineaceae bacterium]|nr:hypothetical protein [Caldilineaceae bacterium]